MKRGTLALAAFGALAALIVPAGASGGQAGDNYRISLTLKTFNGEPTKIKNFRFSRLNATCDDGVKVEIRGRIRSMPVNDRNRFSGKLRRNGRTVWVKGKVSADLERVKGTIRAKGDYPPGENCGTGRVRWRTD